MHRVSKCSFYIYKKKGLDASVLFQLCKRETRTCKYSQESCEVLSNLKYSAWILWLHGLEHICVYLPLWNVVHGSFPCEQNLMYIQWHCSESFNNITERTRKWSHRVVVNAAVLLMQQTSTCITELPFPFTCSSLEKFFWVGYFAGRR